MRFDRAKARRADAGELASRSVLWLVQTAAHMQAARREVRFDYAAMIAKPYHAIRW
jgi:hypothetical protein